MKRCGRQGALFGSKFSHGVKKVKQNNIGNEKPFIGEENDEESSDDGEKDVAVKQKKPIKRSKYNLEMEDIEKMLL